MISRAAIPRADVLGVGVSAIALYQATRLILDGVRCGQRGYVTVTGVHGVMEAQRCPDFRRILNDAWLTTPDGMPMSWVARVQGFSHTRRVYGPDLMSQIFANTTDGQVRHFLYGGSEGVAQSLKSALEERFPGVRVVGTFTPPFRPLNQAEQGDLHRQVLEAEPHLFWVGLEYAEAGAVHGSKLVGVAWELHDWGRSGLRHVIRSGQPGTAVDARIWAGVVVPTGPRTEAIRSPLLGQQPVVRCSLGPPATDSLIGVPPIPCWSSAEDPTLRGLIDSRAHASGSFQGPGARTPPGDRRGDAVPPLRATPTAAGLPAR